MKYKLIKIDCIIVIESDEIRNINDFYIGQGFAGPAVFNWDISQEKLYPNKKGKLIASDFHLELPQIDYNGFEEDLCVIDLTNLCYYDARNPDNNLDFREDDASFDKDNNGNCYCDNCFYGRTILTKKLIKLQQLSDKKFSLEDVENAIDMARERIPHPDWDFVYDEAVDIIKVLQQPKEFDVELEMHYNPLIPNAEFKPKITNNKVKIMKVYE